MTGSEPSNSKDKRSMNNVVYFSTESTFLDQIFHLFICLNAQLCSLLQDANTDVAANQ